MRACNACMHMQFTLVSLKYAYVLLFNYRTVFQNSGPCIYYVTQWDIITGSLAWFLQIIRAVRSAISTILSSVRQSLCLQRGVLRRLESVWGLKLYHHVSNKELPIHFFKHLSCTVYRLATKHSHRQTSWLASKADFMTRPLFVPFFPFRLTPLSTGPVVIS